MRKRSYLVVLLAVAVAAAVSASAALGGSTGSPVVAADGNSQAVGVVFSPKKLGKKTFTPAALEVTTALSNPSSSNGVPVPTTNVVIDFDQNVKIFTKGVPTCSASQLQSVSTEIALEKCGKAKIGSGTGTALLPVGGKVFTINPVVTAFNGAPKGGKPVILLHVYSTTPIQTTLVLTGTVKSYNKQGYGPRLDVEVPLLAGGAGALTYFNVKVKKTYRYKGKSVSYISAKCPNSKKLKARSVFTFKDGQTANPTYVQTCAQNPKK